MKEIQLNTQRPKCKNYMKHIALIDDDDYDLISAYNWFVLIKKHTTYVLTKLGNGHAISMHRLICNFPDNMVIDHKDGNGLNNQRSNLRICTTQQNQMNKKKRSILKSSIYKGVTLMVNKRVCTGRSRDFSVLKKYYTWRAMIMLNGKKVRIGTFKTEIEAAIAYDKTAKIYHGEFASLNFPDE